MQTIGTRRIADAADDHWWTRAHRNALLREVRHLTPPGIALDIGAGGGAVSRALMSQSWDVTAVDTSPSAVAHCRAIGVDAYEADARWLPLPSDAFDLVTCFETLSRIEEDDQAAHELTRVLRPGGTALITVPHDMALWSAHDLTLGRVRRYSRDAATLLLTEAGLTVDALINLNTLLRPLIRLTRHRTPGFEHTARHRTTNRLLTLTQSTDRHLQTLPGTTLLLRAHRPT
ncbi:putative S-adenosylmethionine-dependent methyltransferase [Actinomadura rubteroloni]|uniref:Putative S-adenosylmethionine-dependent methyltransferase n=1 Tax=Actinomadura rubteroloni TaxID=1926885 RepID=A0A2P4UJN2_9ACTN|nr:class I SAM-dependent methyltransferase [Actinomadura rubteroloni]POM25265.1 putative S-adenosylmethionine-dependent methyltransferase [Actinomadura rubteroloni]